MLSSVKMMLKETSRVDQAFQRASGWCEGVKTVGLNAFRSRFPKAFGEYGRRETPVTVSGVCWHAMSRAS